MPRTLLLAILIPLAACEAGSVTSDPCGPWRAIRTSKGDVLTEGTARQLLAHNLAGQRLCHWEARP